MKLSKSERERRIFEALAQLIGLEVVPGSITQPDPPDILCYIVGQGELGIELVALDSPETRARLDNMMTTDEAWIRALRRQPAENLQVLQHDTANVFFSIAFRNDAGLRDRTTAMLAIQRFLLKHPAHTGVVPPEALLGIRGIEQVTIHRGHVTHGPKFSHFSAGRWAPPQASVLEAKLAPGRYPESNIPLELFAYAVHDEPDLAVGSLERLKETVTTKITHSVFRRVHVFDLGFQRHLFSHPNVR